MFELVPARLVDSSVWYLHQIEMPVGLRNRSGSRVHLHEVRLVFKAHWQDVPAEFVTIRKPCHGRTMEDGQFQDFSIQVRPSLVFLAYTNTCSVEIEFSRDRASASVEVARIDGEHIIVKDCPNYAGVQAFVSFKDDEDLDLAQRQQTLLNRAGIRGYMARDDVQPGTDFWKKIVLNIRSSVATFVVWTRNTAAQYKSVEREIVLSEEAGIPVVLLLEDGVEAPASFKSHRIEYVPFKRDSPSVPFAKATEAVYEGWRNKA